LIQLQINMAHLIFKSVGMKFEAKREKTGGKEKRSIGSLPLLYHAHTPDHAEKDVMTISTSSQNIAFDC